MQAVATILGIAIALVVLWDAFVTVILPRTVKRGAGLTSLVYGTFGDVTFWALRKMKPGGARQLALIAFGPISFILMMAIWAALLIVAVALVLWGLAVPLTTVDPSNGLGPYFYYSGVTFFTLGFGDIVPMSSVGRMLAVIEAGMGFGFLAIVISYVPVLYNAFSRREIGLELLDSKAGSDPTAGELLRRHAEAGCMRMLTTLLKEWERWSGELLEAYLSYPVLAYYRSQHDHQSWLRSMTAILDACAIIEGGFEGSPDWERELQFQAKATFAMARHVLVDLAYVLDLPPDDLENDRCDSETLSTIARQLAAAGVTLDTSQRALDAIHAARRLYEPYSLGLGRGLIIELPEWIPAERTPDNWQTSAWDGDEKHF